MLYHLFHHHQHQSMSNKNGPKYARHPFHPATSCRVQSHTRRHLSLATSAASRPSASDGVHGSGCFYVSKRRLRSCSYTASNSASDFANLVLRQCPLAFLVVVSFNKLYDNKKEKQIKLSPVPCSRFACLVYLYPGFWSAVCQHRPSPQHGSTSKLLLTSESCCSHLPRGAAGLSLKVQSLRAFRGGDTA